MEETPTPSIEGSAPIVIEDPALKSARLPKRRPLKRRRRRRGARRGRRTPALAEPAPMVDGLTGSKWTYNQIELEFLENGKVHLKGGPVPVLAQWRGSRLHIDRWQSSG